MKMRPEGNERILTSRGALTRQRIVDVAAALIYARGVECTCLDDVCRGAEVSKSQLYHYFVDKDALTREIITTQSQRSLAAQTPLIDGIESLADFRNWASTFLALYKSAGGTGGCPLGSLASELANRSEPARVLLVAAFEAWTSRLARGFERMRMSGELEPRTNSEYLAQAVFAALQGGLLLTKTAKNEAPLESAITMAITYVEHYRSRVTDQARLISND
jgi:TetR/AcrR family transcriptional repressor of nem operon